MQSLTNARSRLFFTHMSTAETIHEEANQESTPATDSESLKAQAEQAKAERDRELQDVKTVLYIKELESKVSTYETKLTDIRDYVKKMEGEIEQIRLRTQRDSQKNIDKKISDFLVSLLSVADNFELSLQSAKDEQGPLVDGLKLIHSQLQNFLTQSGLERISTKGEMFDPHKHEALCTQPVDSKHMDGAVLQETKAGYKFKELIIRPAQVVVGKSSSGEDE